MGLDLLTILPELSLICLTFLLLITDVFLPRAKEFKNYRLTFWLAIFILFTIALLVYWQNFYLNNININNINSQMVINDKLSYILKSFMVLFVLFSFYFSDAFLRDKQIYSGEYYALGLFSLLGMMILVSAVNLVTIYLGLELFSLPVYAMIAMQRESSLAGEASLKYFVMGAIASGVLLFGLSIIYGITGSLVLLDIYNYTNITNPAFVLGLIFICVGIAFKFGAAPFHMWMPDVYQGAPTPAALFIAVAPKLAAFGMAVRLLHQGFDSSAQSWEQVLYFTALLSIVWGTIGALAQTNLKRLLAYSGISHIGFVLFGLVASASAKMHLAVDPAANLTVLNQLNNGYSAALFYVIVYALTSLAIFGFILMYGNSKFELSNLEDYKGLYHKQPWLALMLLVLLFSMAGVPPFVGFFAKMAIIKSIIAAGYFYTAVFIVLLSVVGAFYYLKLIWLMFFEEPDIVSASLLNQASNHIALDMKILVSLNCLLVLGLGLYSNWLFTWCCLVF